LLLYLAAEAFPFGARSHMINAFCSFIISLCRFTLFIFNSLPSFPSTGHRHCQQLASLAMNISLHD
jgi:hypothetical protein